MTGLMIIITIVVYLLPTAVAGLRHHHNDLAISVLNIGGGAIAVLSTSPILAVFLPEHMFSWAALRWAIAMVWSCTYTPTKIGDREQLVADVANDKKQGWLFNEIFHGNQKQ
jgi:hypothetical protein